MKLRRLVLFVSSCLLIVGVVNMLTSGAHKVSAAATNHFPNSATTPDGGAADVSLPGANSNNNAPLSHFEIATRTPGNVTVYITDCTGAANTAADLWVNSHDDDNPDNDVDPAKAVAVKHNTSDCQNNCPAGITSCVKFNVDTKKNFKLYDGNLSTAVLTVQKSGQGHSPFDVYVDDGGSPNQAKVSFRGDTHPNSTSGAPDSDNAFSLYPGNGPGNPSFSFTFKASCNYKNGDTVYLKWSDADRGSTGMPTQGTGIHWVLKDLTKNMTLSSTKNSGPLIGGPGVAVEAHDEITGFINKTDTYRWEWFNIDHENAVTVTVPFSENSVALGSSCNQDPVGQLQMSCDNNYTVRNAHDPDRPNADIKFRIVHGTSGSFTTDVGSTNINHDSTKNGTKDAGSFSHGRTYKLQVYDDDINKWSDPVATDDFPNRCPGPTTPPPPTADVTCTEVDLENITPHSQYRVTMFPKYQNYLAATPSSPTAKNSGPPDVPGGPTTQPSHWATFSNPSNPYFSQIHQSYVRYSGDDASDPTGDPNYDYDYQDKGQPITGPDFLVYYEQWQHFDSDGNGSLDSWKYFLAVNQQTNCYGATCSIDYDSNVPGEPANSHKVLANSYITMRVRINNTGQMPMPENTGATAADGSGHLNVAYDPVTNVPGIPNYGVAAYASNTRPIDPGGHYDFTYALGTPSTIGNYKVGLIVNYLNKFGFTPSCTTDATGGIPVYVPFKINPYASITGGSQESPTQVNFTTGGTKEYGPTIFATATYWLDRNSYSGASTKVYGDYSANHNYGANQDDNSTYYPPPGSFSAGDQYCPSVRINTATGYRGPDGPFAAQNLIQTQSAEAHGSCLKVVNEPYTHVFNSDASAGGGFGENCTSTSGGIATYSRDFATAPGGSGAEFGALAIGPIYGFNSAILRTSGTPYGPYGSSFSNQDNIGGGSANAVGTGGNLGTAHCISDFFGSKPASTPQRSDYTRSYINQAGGSREAQYIDAKDAGTAFRLNGIGLNNGSSLTLYVKGDVIINNDITYLSNSWGDPASVPSFNLYVTEGSIYISNTVHQLDGIYVAQGNPGNIHTCGVYDNNQAYSYRVSLANCRSQLVVNGGFVSNKTYLERSFSSIRYSANAERYRSPGSPGAFKDCGEGYYTSYGDCAAEIFNFSPETYFAQPVSNPVSGPTTGKYDSVTSLAPVL